MATTTAPRFQVRPQRVTGAYVLDTHTGAVWTGYTRVGARQLADHFNRRAA
jgi:predicted GIY-YIG superfamily endonuclease